MLETIDEICRDRVSQKILNLLTAGWMPIKVLIAKLGVDRHTAYRRFEALERLSLVIKSRQKHEASKYRVFGFSLTESGKILAREEGTAPSISFTYPLHAFEHNYVIEAKLFWYPDSEAYVFSSDAGRYHLRRGLFNLFLELWRDPNISLGNHRLILDCKFKALAELDIYEFYRECLSPSLDSYVRNRAFSAEKRLAVKVLESPNYALNLVKLTRFAVTEYSQQIGKENIVLINVALDRATKEIENRNMGWAERVSPLLINAYLFMLASIYEMKGKLPDPELYFELWFSGIQNLKKLRRLYRPLLKDLRELC